VLVVLSADMEGVSQLRLPREILAACPEYWRTGRPRYEEEVAAACEGLLAGGATEVVVLDNHASGNPTNLSSDALPAGARLEAWDLWEVPRRGADAMLQVGYHARGGLDGFLSHTYVPGLRLRCGDELISESHGRAWAAQARLIGIIGNDVHGQTLGSLSGTPFLVVQRSEGHGVAEPAPELDALREFARRCVENASDVGPVEAPAETCLAASMPNGAAVEATMRAGGWTRTGDVEYEVELRTWDDARGPVGAAMLAAFSPILPAWSNDLTSPALADDFDPAQRGWLGAALEAWAEASEPEWFAETAPAFGEQLDPS
jgi:D-aminopeptidase